MKLFLSLVMFTELFFFSGAMILQGFAQDSTASGIIPLRAVQDDDSGTITIWQEDNTEPILVQNAQDKIRPYLHPITAPDGNGVLTEYRPGHHRHQTGIYWGLKEVNGRDYFMDCCKPGEEGFYRKLSSEILIDDGPEVSWQTVYDLLDENGKTMLTETHIWTMKNEDEKYYLDLQWIGSAKTDITVEHFFVGGLFVRMPWYRGIDGEVINSAGQINHDAEGKRALWTNVGMAIDGRDDWGNIAIFEHKENVDFPVPWRVDGELGVGPSRQISGDWELKKGESETFRYRLLIYTGMPDYDQLNKEWHKYNIGM
jgi:hypothetical protein